MEYIFLLCFGPIFLCMLVYILFGWARELSNRRKPEIPKPDIKPPAQKPTKIMGQNTARDFRLVEISLLRHAPSSFVFFSGLDKENLAQPTPVTTPKFGRVIIVD